MHLPVKFLQMAASSCTEGVLFRLVRNIHCDCVTQYVLYSWHFGGKLNLAGWRIYEQTAKFNSMGRL